MLENIKEVLISIATNNPPFLYDYFMTVSGGVFILCVFVEAIIYRNHHKKNKEHEGIE